MTERREDGWHEQQTDLTGLVELVAGNKELTHALSERGVTALLADMVTMLRVTLADLANAEGSNLEQSFHFAVATAGLHQGGTVDTFAGAVIPVGEHHTLVVFPDALRNSEAAATGLMLIRSVLSLLSAARGREPSEIIGDWREGAAEVDGTRAP